MNTYQLDTMTLNLLQLEDNGDNRNQFSPLFTSAYNEAYMDIARNYLKPKHWQQLTLTDRKFDVSTLDYTPTKFLKAASNPDYSQDGGFNFQGGYEVLMYDNIYGVVPAFGEDECYILYEYLPTPLVNDDPDDETLNVSEPTLILGDDRQTILCNYAVSLYYATFKKPSLAEYFYQRYLRGCENLSCLKKLKVSNKYI